MIANGKDLYNLIDSLLKPHNYVRKKDTWYLHTTECICFLSIVKSKFSGAYDHVMGCFLKELYKGKEEFPKYFKNHLKFGIDNFVDKEQVKRVFDLENTEFTGNEREEIIRGYIEKYVIPFLNDVSSKHNIKKAVEKYKDLIYWLDGDLRIKLKLRMPG